MAFALVFVFAFGVFAFNSLKKPMNVNESPGDWGAAYNASAVPDAVHALFAWPESLRPLLGDHPDFASDSLATAAEKWAWDDNKQSVRGYTVTNKQLSEYFESLPKTNMTIRYLGDYPKGIPLPLLVFSKPKLDDPSGENLRALGKPVFYLRASVHGNEWPAQSGAVLFAQRLANGHADFDGVLDKISVVIMPRVNSDGTKNNQRGSSLVSGDRWGSADTASQFAMAGATTLDTNRDNPWLDHPAVRRIARILAEYKPEFVMDMHEMGTGSTGYYFPTKTPVDYGNGFVYSVGANDRISVSSATRVFWKEQLTTQPANHLAVSRTMFDYIDTIEESLAAKLENPSNPTGPFFWSQYHEGNGYGMRSGGGTAGAGTLISLDAVPSEYRANMSYWVDANGNVPHYDSINAVIESGLDHGNARNHASLTPSIAFLLESRGQTARWEYARRTMGQYLGSYYYMQAILDDFDNAVAMVNRERDRVVGLGKAGNIGAADNTIILNFKEVNRGYGDVVSHEVLLSDGSTAETIGIRVPSRSTMIATEEVGAPFAYIMRADYEMADTIADRMSNQGAVVERTTEPMVIEVEAYTVTDASGSAGGYGARNAGTYTGSRVANGSFGYGDSRIGIQTVDKATKTVLFPEGSYIYYMEQMAGLHIGVTMEPMSWRGWWGKDRNAAGLAATVGVEVPIYRYVIPSKIQNAEPIDIVPLDWTDVTNQYVHAYPIAGLLAAREKSGVDGYAQTVRVYGELGAPITRAFIPDNGTRRSWHVLNRVSGEWVAQTPKFDADMNRHYLEISGVNWLPAGDGYFEVDVMAGVLTETPEPPEPPVIDDVEDRVIVEASGQAWTISAVRKSDGTWEVKVHSPAILLTDLPDDVRVYQRGLSGVDAAFLQNEGGEHFLEITGAAGSLSDIESFSLSQIDFWYDGDDATYRQTVTPPVTYDTIGVKNIDSAPTGGGSGGGCDAGFGAFAAVLAAGVFVLRKRG
jgi:Synergist-CTERM protein sorting domain-containing protein